MSSVQSTGTLYFANYMLVCPWIRKHPTSSLITLETNLSPFITHFHSNSTLCVYHMLCRMYSAERRLWSHMQHRKKGMSKASAEQSWRLALQRYGAQHSATFTVCNLVTLCSPECSTMVAVQASLGLFEASTCTDSCETVICCIYMRSMYISISISMYIYIGCRCLLMVHVNRMPAIGSTGLQWYNSSDTSNPSATLEYTTVQTLHAWLACSVAQLLLV